MTGTDSCDLQEYDGEFKLDGGWLTRGVSNFTSFGFFLKSLLGFLAAAARPFGLAYCHAYIVNPIRLKQEPKESIRIIFLKA